MSFVTLLDFFTCSKLSRLKVEDRPYKLVEKQLSKSTKKQLKSKGLFKKGLDFSHYSFAILFCSKLLVFPQLKARQPLRNPPWELLTKLCLAEEKTLRLLLLHIINVQLFQ